MYICGTYYPAAGGAEISMHTFLKEAVSRGHKVHVATDLSRLNRSSEEKNIFIDRVTVHGIQHNSRCEEITDLIEQNNPDWIITQLMWSDVTLKIAKEKKIKSILRFCKIPAYLNISENSKFAPTKIMVVSEYVRQYVKDNWQRDSMIISPPIDEGIILSTPNQRNYITMFNPNEKKGGEIFKEIASKMPNHKFLAVGGWDILKNGNETNTELVARLCESLRIPYHGKKLNDINFEGIPNLTKLPFTRQVSEIYAKTRILCVPSQWQEAFGRVSIEGMINSIPVIGSNVGGLSEIVQKGGIIIEDYSNATEWIRAISKLDDPEEYSRIVEKGRKYISENYNYVQIQNKFFELLENK